MKIALSFLLVIHGLIHLMGFVKGFELAEIKELTLPIGKTGGALWLLAFLLFLITAWLYITQKTSWWIWALFAASLSQVLIFLSWQDAKFGTIPNLLILLVALVGFGSWEMENKFRKDVAAAMKAAEKEERHLLSEEDLISVPQVVQKYLRYVGVIDQDRVHDFRVKMKGEMRNKEQDWFSLQSQQYNVVEPGARLFFMKGIIKGLPALGYHRYKDREASMLIKLLSLIPVVKYQGKEIFISETVTLFNDRCLMAPSSLLDPEIAWEEIDDLSVKATFSNEGVSISAILYFNPEGQLINFVSNDRYEINEGKRYPFSTPVSNYKYFGAYRLPSYGKAIWDYPDGKFTYAKFEIESVVYNVAEVE